MPFQLGTSIMTENDLCGCGCIDMPETFHYSIGYAKTSQETRVMRRHFAHFWNFFSVMAKCASQPSWSRIKVVRALNLEADFLAFLFSLCLSSHQLIKTLQILRKQRRIWIKGEGTKCATIGHGEGTCQLSRGKTTPAGWLARWSSSPLRHRFACAKKGGFANSSPRTYH